MKRILSLVLVIALVAALVACGGNGDDTTTTAATTTTDTTVATTNPAVNTGTLKTGKYTADTVLEMGEGMTMPLSIALTLNADGTFVVADSKGAEKGKGTYALTDSRYVLSYADGKTATIIVNADGTLSCTSSFPYGVANIYADNMKDVKFTFAGGAEAESTTATTQAPVVTNFTMGEGTYTTVWEKTTMMGKVTYTYVAKVGAGNTFEYSTTFVMGGNEMPGVSAKGTYKIENNKFIFTAEDGTVYEGTMLADDQLKIAIKSSAQASSLDEIVFGESDAPDFTIAAGAYKAIYSKASMMGPVDYTYTAVIGADGTFEYSTTFVMGGNEMAGVSAKGTYTLDGNVFTFTDEAGNKTEGRLTADNKLKISLKASEQAKEPYEVTFKPAVYTLAEGTYEAAYTKVSPMAGTVVYNYTATVGANGAFSYSVKFAMGENMMDGATAQGTYTLEGNTFTFTDAAGNKTEGKLTANNELTISLKASDMAKDPYEVTFKAAK